MKQGKMIGYFISDQQSDYYQSKRHQVLQFVQKNSSICKMKEKQTHFAIAIDFDNVKNRTALEFMEIGRRIRQCSFQPFVLT
jgi:transcription-repair coupling factor (superfamily II helicase)